MTDDRLRNLIANKQRRCHHQGCSSFPSYALKLTLHGDGYAMPSIFGIHSCAEHRHDITPDTFFVDEGKDMIRTALLAVGKSEPDFSLTKFEWVLISEAFKAMQGE